MAGGVAGLDNVCSAEVLPPRPASTAPTIWHNNFVHVKLKGCLDPEAKFINKLFTRTSLNSLPHCVTLGLSFSPVMVMRCPHMSFSPQSSAVLLLVVLEALSSAMAMMPRHPRLASHSKPWLFRHLLQLPGLHPKANFSFASVEHKEVRRIAKKVDNFITTPVQNLFNEPIVSFHF